MRALAAVSLLALASCRSDRASQGTASADGAAAATTPAAPLAASFAARPYALHVPPGWDRGKPAPLVLFFHGYGAPGGEEHAHGLGVDTLADEAGFVLVTPDGTPDSHGRRFWNATDACCDFDGKRPDDVGYVRWILDDVASKMPIDPARVYVAGHSNGGFFSHRLACELAPRVAAAVSLAGAQWSDPTRCHAGEPVSVLEIHGDADEVVHYGGGRIFDLPARTYPGALDTTADWARLDGCGQRPEPVGARFDFDADVPGPDTTRLSYPSCRAGASVELWTEAGGGHLPHPTPAGLQAVWAWMLAHAKAGAPPR